MLYDRPLLQSWGELFGKNSLQAYKDWAQLATDEKNQTPQQISNDFNKQFAAEIAAMKEQMAAMQAEIDELKGN